MAQEYDIVLKLLFRESAQLMLKTLAGAPVVDWLDQELPEMRNHRADMVGRTGQGEIVHLEFQSSNAKFMEVRMAAYYIDLVERFGRHVRQALVYVGRDTLRMKDRYESPAMSFRYSLVDIRDLDGESFLASPAVGDQILAVLMRLKDQAEGIRRILESIAGMQPAERLEALDQLLIISGLRGLEIQIEREIQHMPVLNSLLDHKVYGREFKKGLEKGREEGREEGLSQGGTQLLHRLLIRRFKRLPKWAEARLAASSPHDVEQWGERLLEAKTLREVFADDSSQARDFA